MAANPTPPSVLYLAIYNPTLRPATAPVDEEEDEDAEEQAHILFYTSRERAAPRDKMLRQVGLAKAMVNFSELFSPEETFENAHSQTRRLVTVSPEPDFWLHAGIELGRSTRVSKEASNRKSRDKSRGKESGKKNDKGKGKAEVQAVCDPVESSVHDLVARDDLLHAYETFKLTHGSFSSILLNLGREALELQLERFFTVWAWSWDLEDRSDFGAHLGTPTHPFYQKLLPTFDRWTSSQSAGIATIVLAPPCIIPSTRYVRAKYPAALPRHLLSVISHSSLATPRAFRKPPIPRFGPTSPAQNENGRQDGDDKSVPPRSRSDTTRDPSAKSGNAFLGIPNVNFHVNMDVRKWHWPGYMTFGKGGAKKPPDSQEKDKRDVVEAGGTMDDKHPSVDVSNGEPPADTEVGDSDKDKDKADVAERVTEADDRPPSIDTSNGNRQQQSVDVEDQPPSSTGANPSNDTTISSGDPSGEPDASTDQKESLPLLDTRAKPPPSFSSMKIFLDDGDDCLPPARIKIFYITCHELTLALVGMDSIEDDFTAKAAEFLKEMQNLIQEQASIQASNPVLPSVSRILQPQDKHVLSKGGFTYSSEGFQSTSEHFFNAQQALERDPDVSEMFSRGQNPQHWHVAKRGLGKARDIDGDVYLEVARKETSLTDVDNMLAGLVKGFAD